MNARAVSLPELVTEKRRNTALSLSEGFAGARHAGALSASAQNFAPRPGMNQTFTGSENSASGISQVLPIYYRTRQLVLSTEKSGFRVPQKLLADLRALERSLGLEIRGLHPLLFQRFDDMQMDRLLRAMPFLRLSQGRWVFGADTLNAAWPPTTETRAFILLSGRVSLFPDPVGAGERTEVHRGAIFGERHFRIGDESFQDVVAGSACCEEPCTVGLLGAGVLEAAFADRAFGNRRISQLVKRIPALQRVVHTDAAKPAQDVMIQQDSKTTGNYTLDDKESNAVHTALREIGKVASTLHVGQGCEVLCGEPLEESVLVVSRGILEVRGNVTLTEKLEALPPKKARLRVHVEKAEGLKGEGLFDKLDPYCVVKLGDFKRFQTPVLWNVGVNPKFDHHGVLTFKDEEMLEFTIMDRDQFSADNLCGSASISVKELYDGYKGKLELTRPRQGIFSSDESLDERAGRIYFSISWDYEKITALTKAAKERTWTNQVLFTLKELDCWGHEHLMLGSLFKRTLEQASTYLAYRVTLDSFRVVGGQSKVGNENVICWKASRDRFEDFIRHCGREKQFLQTCRLSSLEKQLQVKELAVRLLRKWEVEEQALMIRNLFEAKAKEEAIDPQKFRLAYRGVKAHISIRNALNLGAGSWFEKLDPYAVARFRGSKAELRTSVLQDTGSDPVWDCEGTLVYNGETTLELSIWDFDRQSADELLGTGVVQVEQFCSGFEGMVPLTAPGDRKKKGLKQSMIIIGIQWDPPKDLSATLTTTLSNAGFR